MLTTLDEKDRRQPEPPEEEPATEPPRCESCRKHMVPVCAIWWCFDCDRDYKGEGESHE